MRDAEVVLAVHDLGKSYGAHQALSGLAFEMRAGEILGLLGPNGAGKTTAIRILTTILPASRGSFSVAGIPQAEPAGIRALIGSAPENCGFPGHMSATEYLRYVGRLYGLARTQAQAKATELLRLFGLTEVAAKRISAYSRGMKQRLTIARSFINDPKVLFLDEPTLGLDPRGQREMLRAVREAADISGVAVVLSSHLLEVVESICNQILILNRGRTVAHGTVAEIKRQVAGPLICHVRTKADAVPKAISAISSIPGVAIEHHADQNGELIISIQREPDAGDDMNTILRHLVRAEVPIEAFSQESVPLVDAFISVTEAS